MSHLKVVCVLKFRSAQGSDGLLHGLLISGTLTGCGGLVGEHVLSIKVIINTDHLQDEKTREVEGKRETETHTQRNRASKNDRQTD